MTDNRLTRREAIALGGLGLAGSASLLLGGCDRSSPEAVAAAADASNAGDNKVPTHIVMLVSDGMSMGVPSLAEPFSKLVRGQGTAWHAMLGNDKITHGLLATSSLNSLVTDSAAAASAWGSGSRINNGSLNILPDGTKLQPLAHALAAKGKAVGLVTTDRIGGATPAGFAASQVNRNAYDTISMQYLDCVDILMGGGREYFDALTREDHQDLIGRFQTSRYDFCDNRGQLLSRGTSSRLLALFGEGRLPYTIDHMHDPQARRNVPTLAEMTRHAMMSLLKSSAGSFLMVEGARIDHAAHANDAAAMLWDQIAFDDAVAVALSLAADRDDVLVIVTSDHGNANPGLCGMGSKYSQSTETFKRLAQVRTSFSTLAKQIKLRDTGLDPTDLTHHAVKHALGIDLPSPQAHQLAQALIHNKPYDEVRDQHRNWVGLLGQHVANHIGIGWAGISHTSDHVLVSAVGPGAGWFSGLQHHTHMHGYLCQLLGVTSANPTASEPVPLV